MIKCKIVFYMWNFVDTAVFFDEFFFQPTKIIINIQICNVYVLCMSMYDTLHTEIGLKHIEPFQHSFSYEVIMDVKINVAFVQFKMGEIFNNSRKYDELLLASVDTANWKSLLQNTK